MTCYKTTAPINGDKYVFTTRVVTESTGKTDLIWEARREGEVTPVRRITYFYGPDYFDWLNTWEDGLLMMDLAVNDLNTEEYHSLYLDLVEHVDRDRKAVETMQLWDNLERYPD